MHKQRILLYWPYSRANWVKVFNELKEDFDFVFLNHVTKDQENISFIDCRKIYWFDYKNVQDIIRAVKPDKVVFMGLDNHFSILLNYHCGKKKIPTYFFQHGIFHPFKAYLEELEMEKRKATLNPESQPVKSKKTSSIKTSDALKFIARSFSLKMMPAFFTLFQIELLVRVLRSHPKAFFHTKYKARFANHYIVFTKFCSFFLVERDGLADNAFIEVGNPEADEILLKIEKAPVETSYGDFFLLIDDPLGPSEEFNSAGFFTQDFVNDFHKKLNDFALSQKKKLVIKLHPYSYNCHNNYIHPNIVYLREVKVESLIKSSSGVFGGLSTLMVPALASVPCCLFKYNDLYALHGFLNEIDYCPVLSYYDFGLEDICFYDRVTKEQQQQFISKYLYSNDRNSLKRIREVFSR